MGPEQSSKTEAALRGRTLSRADAGPLVIAILCSLVVCIWPYTAPTSGGSRLWVADFDEINYLIVASNAYFNHPFALSDPVVKEGGRNAYTWLNFGPGILVAKAFSWPPIYLGLIWRIMSGLAVGALWYVVFRRYLSDRVVALA